MTVIRLGPKSGFTIPDDPDACWLWTGTPSRRGYGRYTIRGPGVEKYLLAHHLVWGWLHGDVPEGLELDHTCHVKLCVNPSHLEAVTNAENIRRHYTWARENRIQHPPRIVRHGTRWAYEHLRCRCAVCTASQRQFRKERHRRRRLNPTYGSHGKVSSYRNGCHCDLCRAAIRVYSRAYKGLSGPGRGAYKTRSAGAAPPPA